MEDQGPHGLPRTQLLHIYTTRPIQIYSLRAPEASGGGFISCALMFCPDVHLCEMLDLLEVQLQAAVNCHGGVGN